MRRRPASADPPTHLTSQSPTPPYLTSLVKFNPCLVTSLLDSDKGTCGFELCDAS